MQYYGQGKNPCTQMLCSPVQGCPMMDMGQHSDLEDMYPRVYHIVQPVVERYCDSIEAAHGPMYSPTREQVKRMTECICNETRPECENALEQEMQEGGGERQLGFGHGRRLFGDIALILFLSELARRRRFHYGGYPMPYYYGY